MKQFIISVVICLTVMILVISGMGTLSDSAGNESAKVLQDAIRRATVQCYALEGAYPESVEYLEDNYGLIIDHDRYIVFYDGFASNIIPDITVITKEHKDE